MPESTRRSGRQRKVNPKYENDGWDKETLRVLRASSESSGSSSDEESTLLEREPGVVANVQAAVAADKDNASQEDYNSSAPSETWSQSADDDSPNDNEDAQINRSSEDETPNGSKGRARRRIPQASAVSSNSHSRGLQATQLRSVKHSSYPSTFGPDLDDLFDVLRARDTWLKGRDSTIPSRETLSVAIEQAKASTLDDSRPSRDFESEAASGEVDGEALQDSQILTEIDQSELHSKYLPRKSLSHSVVLGAWGKQQKFDVKLGSALDFGSAWLKDPKPKENGAKVEENEELGNQDRFHQGWLINVGEKVQCLAWAPCSDSVQYLAIAVRCPSTQRRCTRASGNEGQAFRPSPPYPSSIQIWAFETTSTTYTSVRTLAMNQRPRLALVLATEWGNIRHLKWNSSNTDAGAESHNIQAADAILGQLGVISSDGHARIVRVPRPNQSKIQNNRSEPESLRVAEASLDFAPPEDTIFTAMTFASPTDLLVGAADGTVRLFDLKERSAEGKAPDSYLKYRLHHTYIVSLCAASPGALTAFIASTSASGDMALTDLRSPDQDKVQIPRACFPGRDLIYSPFSRSFIAALDRAGNAHVESSSATFVVCHHLRQFPNSMKIARLPHHCGAATALAGSQWHPCIVVGNARGQVLSTNYLRRVLPYRRVGARRAAGAYMQKICEYDWRPLTRAEEAEVEAEGRDDGSRSPSSAAKPEEGDLFHGRDTRPGVSRFQEGFTPQVIELGNVAGGASKKIAKGEAGHGEVIFEEEQAVTAMDWNPNSACAGIVAVGWGSGIVRVQDLAHDLQ